MASAVEIDANARVLVGLEPSESVDPSSDPTARAYSITRRMVLNWSNWGFAMRSEPLVELTDSPPPGYLTLYRKPSPAVEKLLRLVRITDSDGAIVRRWTVLDAGIALAQYALAPTIWYTVEVGEESWPDAVVSAMEHLLAGTYAASIRDDPELAKELRKMGIDLLRKAASMDAQEGASKFVPEFPV